MNAVDVHPEHLFDKELDGTLSQEERAYLAEHRRACLSCAFASAAQEDFRIGLFEGTERRAVVVPLPRRAWLQWAALLVAGFVGGTAAALAIISVVPSNVEPTPARTARAERVASPRDERQAEACVVAELPVVEEVLPIPSPMVKPAPEREAVRRPAARPDPAALFQSANALRHEGRDREAASAYERLIRVAPASNEAFAARVIAGRLLLYRLGRPAAALRLFDEYIAQRPSGELKPEAYLHRAMAYKSLGERDRERRAWQALVDAFPGSVHADRARERLQELE